jgi:hypothetical protein
MEKNDRVLEYVHIPGSLDHIKTDYDTRFRVPMVVFQIICGLFTIIWIAKLTSVSSKKIPRSLSVTLMVSILLHTVHFAHNIYDPVYYHEPVFLYSPLLFAAMDKMFIYFWILCFIVQTICNLLNTRANFVIIIVVTTVYAIMSAGSGLHFIQDVQFSLSTNLILLLECLFPFIFLGLLFQYRSILI